MALTGSAWSYVDSYEIRKWLLFISLVAIYKFYSVICRLNVNIWLYLNLTYNNTHVKENCFWSLRFQNFTFCQFSLISNIPEFERKTKTVKNKKINLALKQNFYMTCDHHPLPKSTFFFTLGLNVSTVWQLYYSFNA